MHATARSGTVNKLSVLTILSEFEFELLKTTPINTTNKARKNSTNISLVTFSLFK